MTRILKSEAIQPGSWLAFARDTLEEWVVVEELPANEEPEEEVIPPEVIAAQIIDEARREAEETIRQAYAEGYRRGEEAGRTHFLEAVGQAAEALRVSGEAVKEAHEAFLTSLEREAVTLAIAIAERVLRREPRTDVEMIRRAAQAALDSITGREHIRLHLRPSDIRVLEEEHGSLLDEFALQNITIIPDEAIQSGGCILDTDTIQVDARLDAQVQRIIEAVLE